MQQKTYLACIQKRFVPPLCVLCSRTWGTRQPSGHAIATCELSLSNLYLYLYSIKCDGCFSVTESQPWQNLNTPFSWTLQPLSPQLTMGCSSSLPRGFASLPFSIVPDLCNSTSNKENVLSFLQCKTRSWKGWSLLTDVWFNIFSLLFGIVNAVEISGRYCFAVQCRSRQVRALQNKGGSTPTQVQRSQVTFAPCWLHLKPEITLHGAEKH